MGKVAGASVAILICVISLLLLVPMTTREDKHQSTLTQIDKEIENVLKLAGGATAVSAAVSLLPDDSCTPISTQFAELGTPMRLPSPEFRISAFICSLRSLSMHNVIWSDTNILTVSS